MIKLGDYNTLRIKKRTDFGLYLDGGEEGNILLPNRYVPKGYVIGQEIEVFLYLDQDERIVATTEHPVAKVGEFAWMECAWTNEYGAFLNWGLMKDLFCPFREQKQRMVRGQRPNRQFKPSMPLLPRYQPSPRVTVISFSPWRSSSLTS